MRNFLFGILLGFTAAIVAVVIYAKSIDATPVYEAGFNDGRRSTMTE
jgi:hypothetical protein